MFGEPDLYDDHCASCGRGYWFEVGFAIYCEHCGGRLDGNREPEPERPSREHIQTDQDVWDDERFIDFDIVKAFRIIRQLGRLDECRHP